MKALSSSIVAARMTAIILCLSLAGCEPPKPVGPQEIRIESEPAGATLSVNGRDVGKSPYTLKQPAFGRYLVQATMDGFLPLDQMLEVGEQTSPDLTLKLKRIQGLVLFETQPTGAEVSLNGVVKGKTPLLSTDLPTGTYKVSFSLDGYDPREMELVITDRTPKLCPMNMKSNLATVHVESKPAGAAVILDGIHKGQTPCNVENVIIGNHSLKVIKDGFKEYSDEIKLSQTGTFPVTVSLEEQLAVLDVTSTPAEAKVTVNDKFKGPTPISVAGLRDGKYTVVIEKPGYEKVTKIVEIKKSEDAKLDVALEKATGTLALNITPQGAMVVVASEQKGVSGDGPFTLELLPGTYKVEVSKAQHRPYSFKADIIIRKTTSRDVSLQRVFVKDTIIQLKDGRVKRGMIIFTDPDGKARVETDPGIFEEFTKDEIQSVSPIKP